MATSRTSTERARASLPRLPTHYLARPSLDKRLAGLAPVTIVRGPQGYGKSSLVAAWLARQDPQRIVPVWLNLSTSLAQYQTFMTQLSNRLRAGGLLNSSTVLPALVELDQVLAGLPPDVAVVLVLDNIGYLRDRTALAELVSAVQYHQNLHLVVCGRAQHPIETLAASTVEVTVIKPAELLLNIEEIAELADAMGKPLDPATARGLHDALGGWISALRLVIDASADGRPPLAAAREYLRRIVLPFINDRPFFDDQPAPSPLLRYSLADRVDLNLVRQFASEDGQDPDVVVEQLEESGLVERRYCGDRVELGYPGVVRDLLREMYSAADPASAQALHRRLAAWFASDATDEDSLIAMNHAIAGQDYRLAYQLWAEHGMTMTMRQPELLHSALDSIPAEVLAGYPGMRTTRASAQIISRDTDADARMATLRTVVEGCARVVADGLAELDLADLLYIGTGHLIGLRMQGLFAESAAFADSLVPQIDRLLGVGGVLHARLAWFHLQRGLTYTLLDRQELAISCYRRAWEAGTLSGTSYIPANAAANLNLIYAMRGDAQRAQLWSERFAELRSGGYWTDHLAGIGAHVAAGLRALDQLDERTARTEIELVGDGSDALELWPFVAYLHAQYGLHYADPASALGTLEHAIDAHPAALSTQGVAATLLTRARADLLTAAGHGQRARRLLLEHSADNALLVAPLARIHLMVGDHTKARNLLAKQAGLEIVAPRDRLESTLLSATAALRAGDEKVAGQLMTQARELAGSCGIRRAFGALSRTDRGHLLRLVKDAPDSGMSALVPIYPETLELVSLSRSEVNLLEALTGAGTRREVAARLHISLNTAKTQLASLYRKFGVRSREDLLTRARQVGLLR